MDHRDILIEATSSQKVLATNVNNGDQGSATLLGQWPQCYFVWNEIDIFQISDKNLYYALNYCFNRLWYNYNNFKVNFFCIVLFLNL